MQSKNTEIIINNSKEVIKDIVDISPYRIAYYIAKNQTPESENEDSLFIYHSSDHLIFGISDGAGGHPKGKEASFIATNKVVELTKKSKDPNFIHYYEQINEAVRDLKAGAHCTFSMCSIKNSSFHSYSVGDSEVIFWNSIGKKLYSNIPQSEVGYLIQGGSINQEESLDDPNRHFVSNLIGDESIRIESTSKTEIKKGNTLIVGSDGLFDNISHDELTQILTQGPFDKSFETLVEICNKRDPELWRKDDDISFIILRKYQSE